MAWIDDQGSWENTDKWLFARIGQDRVDQYYKIIWAYEAFPGVENASRTGWKKKSEAEEQLSNIMTGFSKTLSGNK